ncbi:MAG: right-handed parallel beta-helix repeat-containing protein, partial [Jejuia sp.]
MIRTLKTIVCFCLLFSQTILNAQTYYVATDGDDANDGSMASPFRTFARAVSAMTAGDECIIRGGTYEEPLIVNKNGNASNYLTFKAADGEDVIIKATTGVTGWQPHSGNIFKANVTMNVTGRRRAVFHNGDYMDLARWPNNEDNDRWTIDFAEVTGGDNSHFILDNVPNIDWTGGTFRYLATHSGTTWSNLITSNTSTVINHAGVDLTKWPFSNHHPQRSEGNIANPHGQIMLFNKLEALDYAREWFYDETNSILYFQPADGNMPADNSVEYVKSLNAIILNGDYIKIDGIEVFGGNIRVQNGANYNQILNCKVMHGTTGYDAFRDRGASSGDASIEVLGKETLVKGCTIDHSTFNGIQVVGWTDTSGTILEGNYIYNTDYIGIHCSPIRSNADNCKILKNTIANAGRDGIYVSADGAEIAYNDVSNCQVINSDSGVFYTVGNTEPKNTEIHHNWFHDSQAPSYAFNPGDSEKAAGIYLDNDSKGYVVHHNVVWNVSWSGYQVNWNNVGLDFYHNTIYDCGKTMDSWVNGRDQENNKIYNNYTNSGPWFTGNGPEEFDIQDNVNSTANFLEDPENLDFMPKIESPMIDAGPIIDGFDKPFTGDLPDVGAYERAGTRWTAGVNAIEDTGQGSVTSVLGSQFTIAVTSETCPEEANGSITISADLEADYQLSFNNEDYNFLKDKSFTDVTPGDYTICFNVKGSSDEQCFVVTVEAAPEITTKTKLNQKDLNVTVTSGTAPFNVYVNDVKVFNTNLTSFSVPVSQGDVVKVKSDKACEGELIQSIDFYAN